MEENQQKSIGQKKEFHDVYKDFLDAKINVRKLTSNEIVKHTQRKRYSDGETVHKSNIEMQNQTKKLDPFPNTIKSESDDNIQDITPKHNTVRTQAESKNPLESCQTRRSGRKIVPSAKVLEASGQSGKMAKFLDKNESSGKESRKMATQKGQKQTCTDNLTHDLVPPEKIIGTTKHISNNDKKHSSPINDGKGKQMKVTTTSHTNEKEKTILTGKTKNVEKEENSGSTAKRIKLQVGKIEVTKQPETTPIRTSGRKKVCSAKMKMAISSEGTDLQMKRFLQKRDIESERGNLIEKTCDTEVVENSKKKQQKRATRSARQKQQENTTDPTNNEKPGSSTNDTKQQETTSAHTMPNKVGNTTEYTVPKQQLSTRRKKKEDTSKQQESITDHTHQTPVKSTSGYISPKNKECKSVDSNPKQQESPADTFTQDKLKKKSDNDELSTESVSESVSHKLSFTTLEKDVAENKKTILEKLNMIMNEKRNKFLALQRKFKIARQTVLKANSKGKDVEKIKCFVCKKSFKFGNYMCEHGRSFVYHHASVCKECGRIFRNSTLLKRHVQRIHYEKSIKCKTCGIMFGLDGDLRRHMERVHKIKVSKHQNDDELKKTYDHDYIMGEDTEKDLQEKKYLSIDRSESKSFYSSIPADYVIKSGDKCICKKCGMVFSSVLNLNYHAYRKHINEKKFFCQDCNKGFTLSKDLKSHTQICHSQNPQQCSICCKKIITKRGLRDHMERYHKGSSIFAMRYQCYLCEKRFGYTKELQDHINVCHTAKNDCYFCGKNLATSRGLRKHMERMHGIEETMHEDEFVLFEIKSLEEKKNFIAQEIKTEEAITFIEENLGNQPIKKSSFKNKEEKESWQIGSEIEVKPSSSPKNRKRHQKQSVNETEMKPSICQKIGKRQRIQRSNDPSGNSDGFYISEHCGATKCKASELQKHVKEAHQFPALNCNFCGILFYSRQKAILHRKQFHPTMGRNAFCFTEVTTKPNMTSSTANIPFQGEINENQDKCKSLEALEVDTRESTPPKVVAVAVRSPDELKNQNGNFKMINFGDDKLDKFLECDKQEDTVLIARKYLSPVKKVVAGEPSVEKKMNPTHTKLFSILSKGKLKQDMDKEIKKENEMLHEEALLKENKEKGKNELLHSAGVTEQDALLLHHFGSVNRNFETDSDQSPLKDSEVSSELLKEANLPGEDLLCQVEELAEEDSKLIDTINASLVAKEVVIKAESTTNEKIVKMTRGDILQRFDETNTFVNRKITGQVNPGKDVVIMKKHVVIQTDKKCTLSVKTDGQGNKSIITGAQELTNATQNDVEISYKNPTFFKEEDSLDSNENDHQDKDEKNLVKIHQIINVPKKLVPPFQAKINLPKPDQDVHNTVVYLPKNIKSVDMTVANMDNDDEDVYILFVM
ncbi:KRAB [Mytilus coruscus]|uniref:KRAB n=1 Tax=Mytilus coruscus TaxID=42192 RepID=A0A6J8DMV4_MYTCO|nr:KRAB [Mytilus coruscus]